MTRKLPPEAERALAEAQARREAQLEREKELETQREGENGGPKHREPTRFGDWERKGIAYDF
ncbi:DUF1674 domain-containing protein [Henriciella aquimarina]|uniref:DUF1674 domain-containing protein n=1 Tax=Henriciella aquimarina TaxID=545261 RepID=UPI000A04A73A|nr:DUF1674 domain-containing protein [Henriciella aquimarina]